MDNPKLSRCAVLGCGYVGHWSTTTGQRCPQHRKDDLMDDKQARKLDAFLASETRRARMTSGCQLYGDDLKSMSMDEIEKADQAGRLDNMRKGIKAEPVTRDTATVQLDGRDVTPVDRGHTFTRDEIETMTAEQQSFYYGRGQFGSALLPAGERPIGAEPTTSKWGSADGGAKPARDNGQLDRRNLAQMSPDQIEAARQAGRLNTVLGIR